MQPFMNKLSCFKALTSVIIIFTLAACSSSNNSGPPAATLDAISISPYQLSIANNSSFQLQAVAFYSDNSSSDITSQASWTLQDNVANIDNTGLLTATTTGSTVITASFEGISTTSTLTVSAATLSSINITPGTTSIANGTSTSLQATGIFSDLTTQDITSQVNWQSSDLTIAEINANGQVTTLSAGSVTITANSGAINQSATILVTAATLSSISVTPGSISLANGTSTNLHATGFYTDASSQDLSSQVSWGSSDNTTAEVNSAGIVTSLSTGSAVISASLGGQSSSATITVTPATLSSISITPAIAIIAKGTNTTLLATGIYSDQSTQDLTQQVSWQSSDNAVVAVSPTGSATGNNTGTATISASMGTNTSSSTITVSAATLNSISVTPGIVSIANGTNTQLQASGVYSDQTTQNLTSQVTWQSTDSAIAEISASGLITGRSVGSTTITANLDGQSSVSSITITTATLTSISISPGSVSLANGTSTNLQATGFYSDSSSQDLTEQVSWLSSAPSIIETNTNGLITGRNTGTGTITASLGDKSNSASITVTAATLSAINITPNTLSLANGTSSQLQANGIYSDLTTQDLTSQIDWLSSDNAIATVSPTGLVTAYSIGTVTITANFNGSTSVASITVSAATLSSINITPNNISIANGTSTTLQANASYTDQTSQDVSAQVSWQLSDNTIAGISPSGLVTGYSAGTVTITANLNGISTTSTINITAAILESISVTSSNASIANGTSTQLLASGIYSDQTTQDLTSQVSWQSSDNAIANVNPAGLVTAQSTGSVTISASLSAVVGSTPISISPATLNLISVTPGNLSIAKGTNTQLQASGTYTNITSQDLTSQVTWQSSDNTIAEVSPGGLITGHNTGSVTIIASLSGISSTASITISAEILDSISLSPGTSSIANGTNLQLFANGIYSDLSTQDLSSQVIWSSSDSTIAEVNPDGLVISHSTGVVTITASLGNINSTAVITVTTATLDLINISPVNTSIANGTSTQLLASGIYSDQTNQNLTAQVTWQSSNSAIAEVNNSGQVTSHSLGVVTITATLATPLGAISNSTTITVTPESLTSIIVTPGNSSIALGTETQLVASGYYSDGSTQDLTEQVSWLFSDILIAETVNNSAGLIKGIATGTTSIAASVNGVTGLASLTVTDAVINTLEINSASSTIAAGTALQLEAIAVYSDNSNQNVTSQALWQSSIPSVATIDSNGIVVGQSVGVSIITLIHDGLTTTFTINITNAILDSIEITPLIQSFPAGTTQAFIATGIYSDSSFQDITELVTWASSNTVVATIDDLAGNKGQLNSLVSGQTNISASLGGTSSSKILTITDATLTSIDISPVTATISNGFSQAFTAVAHYSDGSTNDVTNQANWSTSDAAIANSDNNQNSLIQSLQIGDVTVSVSIGDVTGFANLTINSAILETITIDQLDVSIAKGTQFQFTATGHYSDASTQDLSNVVTWTSSAPQFSTIQNNTGFNGVAQGISEGSSTITASFSGVSDSTTLNVTAATLTSIALQADVTTLLVGTTQNIRATGTYSDSSTQDISNDVTWISSADNIASVSNAATSKGEAIGYADGSADLTAFLNDITSTALTLTIFSDPNAAISISAHASPNVILNDNTDSTILSATIQPADITGIIPDGTQVVFIVTDNGVISTTTVGTVNGVATLSISSINTGFISVEAQIQGSTLTSTTNVLSTTSFLNVISRAVLSEPIYVNDTYLVGSRFGLFMQNLSNRDFNIAEFQILNNDVHLPDSPTPGDVFDDGILSAGELLWAIYLVDTLDAEIVNGGVITTLFYLTDPASGITFGFGANFTP